MKFAETSYARHADEFAADLVDPERSAIAQTWFDETTADYWRHARAYECADCLSGDAGAAWLTVGDGRWGLDSIRLRKRGFAKVLATDISEHLLRPAKERGLIDQYAVENAEHLSFQDRQFDYVFCKEALHHFPRPYLALYEMLRVARKAVFLVEPNDTNIGQARGVPLTRQALRQLVHDISLGVLSRLRGKPAVVRMDRPGSAPAAAGWEESGNYLYQFSRREAEKVALGLNLPQLAVKGLNDHYVKGCEFEPADAGRSKVFREMVSTVELADRHCQAGLREYDLIMVGFFMEAMSESARAKFSGCDWLVMDLPRNPYVKG